MNGTSWQTITTAILIPISLAMAVGIWTVAKEIDSGAATAQHQVDLLGARLAGDEARIDSMDKAAAEHYAAYSLLNGRLDQILTTITNIQISIAQIADGSSKKR